jgi:hypothetical protein
MRREAARGSRLAFPAERMKYIAHKIPTAEPTAALGATQPGTDK